MKKKILSMILAGVMLTAAFSGCASKKDTGSDKKGTMEETSNFTEATSNFNETGYPITNEKSTFKIIAATSVKDIGNTIMMKEISEKTNVYPEWQVIAPTAIDERKALMWASNDLPDVIGPNMLKRTDVDTYGPQGTLMALNKYFDKYMTWMHEFVPESSELWNQMKSYDGNIYYIPSVFNTERYERQYMMNTQWLENLGLSVPKNIDEFYECLVAFRDRDPNGNNQADEIPFAIGQVWGDVFDTMPSFYCFFGRPGTYYLDNNRKVIDGRLYDEHKEGIKFLQKCYNEGLLDKELFTQDTAAFRAKGAANPARYGFMLGYDIGYYVGNDNEPQYDSMPLLADSKGNISYIFGNSNETSTNTQMAITSSCKNPEVVMRWANYMHTPEITMQINYAPMGIGYKDENGKRIAITDAPEGYDSMTSWRQTNNEQQFPRIVGSKAVDDYLLENFGYELVRTEAQKKKYKSVEMYLPYAVDEFPIVAPTKEETEKLNTYVTDLEKYYRETVAQLITSKEDIDAQWSKYIEGMNKLGAQKIIEIKQEQVNRYDSFK